MKSPVIIKSSPSGLVLNLDPEIPFPDLIEAVSLRFSESASFFKDARVALVIRGRKLSREEERELIDAIVNHSRLHVVCLMDEDKNREELYQEAVSRVLSRPATESGRFHYGNVPSGQVIEETESIVILGDVYPTAKIISQGNVIVLGNCMGTVQAGSGGDETCFVFALVLKPHEIHIGSKGARSPFTKNQMEEVYEPEPRIAFVADEKIHMAAMNSEMVHSLLPG